MKQTRKNGTFIHGIASSEHLDSSGERIKIEGVDISSLTKDGCLNFEHSSKEASSIVGKIWEAKKILKREDCENDHHRYFWDKVKMPYIYVAGELFDAVGHKQAMEIAAMVRFDAQEALNKDAKKLINFSIEGSRVEKSGQVITKCVARKVSVTITPCNKVCEAEELKIPTDTKKESDSGSFSFIQDIMSKADEPSCQIMKGENPFLYKNEEVEIPAKEAVKEHKRLVAVLESPSHKDDKQEAKKQRKELKEYKEVDKSIEDQMFYEAHKKKVHAEGKARRAKVENRKKNPTIIDRVKNWAKDKTKPKQAPKQPAEHIQEDSGKIAASEKNVVVKRKLGKYDSNVRKAIAAGCGMGAPSTKVQGDAVAKSEFLYKNENIAPPPKVSNGVKIGQTASGKDVFSHAKVASYQDFSPQDHAEAADFHRQMVLKSPSFRDKEFHLGKMRLHNATFSTGQDRKVRAENLDARRPENEPVKAAVPAMPAKAAIPAPAAAPQQKPAMSMVPQKPAIPNMMNPNLKMAKSEFLMIRQLSNSDINKASYNVREQRKKVFGTNAAPSVGSPMRDKHMEHIKNFVSRFLNLDLKPSGGKVNEKTGKRRDENPEVGVDKPDWRSGQLESQWNPEAAVHEIAHLMLMPKGVGLEEGQRLMDKQYGDVQKQYGYLQQKRSQGEVQPMAAEQLIRRFLGMPASKVSIPVKSKDEPHRMSVEDPTQRIATRIKSGQNRSGEDKYVDLIRQARNLHPEHKQRLHEIFSGNLQFDPDKGWSPKNRSLDAAISNRPAGAVVARQAQKQAVAAPQQELPPNVVRMKQPAPAAPPQPAQPVVNPEPNQPAIKIAKNEQRQVMKVLGDKAFESFEKKEELMAFLVETLPSISDKERLAIAKAVAYTSEKKKELALKDLMDKDDE